MFLCSNSSAVGLWLSRLRNKSRKSFWTISYPPGVINLHSPGRDRRQSRGLELSFHPGLRRTGWPHHRLLTSSICTPGRAPCVMACHADPVPASSLWPLPSLAPCGLWASGLKHRQDSSPHRSSILPLWPSHFRTMASVCLSSPEARGCLLQGWCRPSQHTQGPWPRETRENMSCLAETIAALLLVPIPHHQGLIRQGMTIEHK